MKIFVNGCSITWGAELEGLGHDSVHSESATKIREEKRYSTILGNKLNAEVVNLAQSGVSNDWIVEKTISWFTNNNADLAVIQFTEPSRWVWYDEKNKERWMCIHKTLRNVTKNKRFNNTRREELLTASIYYRSIYSDMMGIQNRWKNQHLLELFFKSKNIRYILVDMKSHHYDQKIIDCNWKTLCENKDIPDLMWENSVLDSHLLFPENYAPDLGVGHLRGGHPSAIGHQRIAEFLIDIYNLVEV